MSKSNFKPMLIRAEVSADKLGPGETLVITFWWKNLGSDPSQTPLQGFADFSMGHQRRLDSVNTEHRSYYTPHPGTHEWQAGEVWKSTCLWTASLPWSGTFHIYAGLCDSERNPVLKRTYIGDVDVSWGWGQPKLEETRRAYAYEADEAESASPAISAGAALASCLVPDKAFPRLGQLGKKRVRPGAGYWTCLRDTASDELLELPLTCSSVRQEGDTLTYHCQAEKDGTILASFQVHASQTADQAVLTLGGVWEQEGLELLEVRMPSLVTVSDDASLVLFCAGGRLIDIKKAPAIAYRHPYDTRNAGAVCAPGGLLLFEGACLDDKLDIAITDDGAVKQGEVGFTFTNRVRAYGPLASVLVESDHRTEFSLHPEGTWQQAARLLRQSVPKGRHFDLYKGAYVYKHIATQGPQPPDGRIQEDSPYGVKRLGTLRSFKEIGADIKKLSNILDGMPQVTYIGGFQRDGFDTCYPYVYETDPRAGSVEDLQEVIRQGAASNAIVGLHDNYDCCFDSEFFDEDIISMDEHGGLWRGWLWAGGMEYVTGLCKYDSSGKLASRIKETIRLYGLKTSSHVDVLTSEVLRYDFDPKHPASADKSLQGKLKLLELYEAEGIDLTSEGVAHPFVGPMSYALWLRDNQPELIYPGERYIPLTAMVYHGKIGYSSAVTNRKQMLWALIKGGHYFVEEDHLTLESIGWFYLQVMVIRFFDDWEIQDIVMEGEKIKAVYSHDSYIEADLAALDYTVVYRGRVIGRNWTTFVPGFTENSYLAYSQAGGAFAYDLPDGWPDGAALRAVTLTTEGEGVEVPCYALDGQVRMELPPGTPVRVVRK